MTKPCTNCEQYKQQLSDKDHEIKQLISKVKHLEEKLGKTDCDQNDLNATKFVPVEIYEELKEELRFYKKGMMDRKLQLREYTLKKLEEDYVRKHPGASLVSQDFDPSLGEDVIDMPRFPKR